MNKKGFELDMTVLVIALGLWFVCIVLFLGVFAATKQKLPGGIPMFLGIAACMLPIAYGMAYGYFGGS